MNIAPYSRTILEKMVSNELLYIGVSYKYVGTYYLRDAIIFATKKVPGQYQTVREINMVLKGQQSLPRWHFR